jgi:hypothetical protein
LSLFEELRDAWVLVLKLFYGAPLNTPPDFFGCLAAPRFMEENEVGRPTTPVDTASINVDPACSMF